MNKAEKLVQSLIEEAESLVEARRTISYRYNDEKRWLEPVSNSDLEKTIRAMREGKAPENIIQTMRANFGRIYKPTALQPLRNAFHQAGYVLAVVK